MDYEYKVGDKVRLISERSEEWNREGRMDGFLNSVQIILYIDEFFVGFENPDTSQWCFSITDIACLVND